MNYQLFDQMRPGEIYAEGGDNQMDPSYTISQPRNDVQSILDETGYSDAMIKSELDKRREHIKRIKEMTGVKEIRGEEAFSRAPDEETAKRFEQMPEMDRMMVQAVARGDLTPEQYRAAKMQQEEKLMGTLSFLAQSMPDQSGSFRDSQNQKLPTTPGNVRDFTQARGDTSVQFEGRKTQHTQFSHAEGGGAGGGGGRGGKEGAGSISPSLKQANEMQKVRDNLMSTNAYLEKQPMGEANKTQYQHYTNEIAKYKVADYLELKGFNTNDAQARAMEALDVDVVERPGESVIIDGKLNVSHSAVLRAISRAAQEKDKKASDVLKIFKEAQNRRYTGPYSWEKQ